MTNQKDDYLLSNDDFEDDGSESDWEPILDADAETDDSSDSSQSDGDATSMLRHQDSLDEQEAEHDLLYRKGSNKLKKNKPYSLSRLSLILLLPVLLLLFTLLSSPTPISLEQFGDDETIYVPGVGFSGFWFTLGRLKSIPDPSSKRFVCFSAGCLGAVTILNNFTVDEMACMAQTAQTNWKNGHITRFQVVQQFVDGLVDRRFPTPHDPLGCLAENNLLPTSTSSNQKVPIDDPKRLSRLHVLTTERQGYSLGKATMRSPKNLEELREMLLQTAWIPMATGDALTYKGHMDGGFSLWQHPKCTKYVTLPLDAKLIFNSLNVNMGVEEAYRLWNAGLVYGV